MRCSYATAEFSDCGKHRYHLERGVGPTMDDALFIMLNPSVAGVDDDPTIRRCIGFARRWGYGRMTVVNMFSRISTDPALVYTSTREELIGPDNDRFVRLGLDIVKLTSGLAVAAWGAHGARHGRDGEIMAIAAGAGVRLKCLGVTKDGQPRHPLRLAADTELKDYPL